MKQELSEKNRRKSENSRMIPQDSMKKTKGILKPTVQSIRTASGDLQRN